MSRWCRADPQVISDHYGRRVRRVVLVLMAVMAAAGCSGGSDEPAADPGAPPAVVLPARPFEVRIDGVDPCSLLTEQQRTELGLDAKPRFSSTLSDLYGGEVPACTTSGFEPRAVVTRVSAVTTVGIELFASGNVDSTVTAMQVQGFPAVLAMPARFTRFCNVVVDVSPGQVLSIQFSDGGRLPPIPQDRLCQDAEVVANEVMQTLLRR